MTTALDRLADAVDRAKAGRPLAPVTVVVPGHASGRDVLHDLARSRSVANTNVLTVAQVVTKLAAPVLAPRQPLPYPLLEAAVQRVLAEDAGVFGAVADEPITAQALAAAARELTGIPDPGIDAPTPLVADLLRVYRSAVSGLTHSHFLPHEAYAAAADNLDRLGAVIVFAPAERTSGAREVIDRLQQTGETVDVDPGTEPTQVVLASDADDEVRAVTRLVRKHLAAGIPGHRIGIFYFYGSDDPYLPLLHEHLAAGRIAFTAPECHTLLDRPVGRALLGMLELDHDKMPRRELFALLAEGALRRAEDDGRSVSQRRLELLTRRNEPVVGGDDWQRLTRVEPDKPDRATAIALNAYVTGLRRDLSATVTAPDWGTVAEHMGHLLDAYFRATNDTAAADLAAVRADCAGLTDMDGIAPPPSAARVRDALTVRLRTHQSIHGTAGAGVSVGAIAAGIGRDLDVSIVVGAA